MKKFIKNILYYLEYIITISLTKAFMLLPEKTRFSTGGKIGSLIFKYVKEVRNITMLNLKLAFPEKSNEELKNIGEKSVKVITKTFFLNMWLDKYLEEDKNFIIKTSETIEKMIEKGPAVIGAMHFGNMEAPIKLSTRIPIVTVAKNRTNPYLNDMIIKNRTRFNISLLQRGKTASRDLVRFAKDGKYPILLSDHRDSKGTEVVFYGRKTTAPVGVASVALKYNRPFYLIYSILNDDNITETYIEEVEKCMDETLNNKERVQKTVQNMYDKMEEVISKYPEQWMWSYDRWKLHRDYKKKVLDNKELEKFIKNFK